MYLYSTLLYRNDSCKNNGWIDPKPLIIVYMHLSFLPKYTHLTILKYDCFYLLELYRWNLETYITSHHSGLRWHNSPPKNSVDGLSDLWPKVVRLVAQGLVLRYYSIADLLLRRKVATGSSKRPHYYSFWTIAHSYWRHYRNWTTTYSPDLMTPKRCDPAPLCSLSLSSPLLSLFQCPLSWFPRDINPVASPVFENWC